jgi:hypothetical protein
MSKEGAPVSHHTKGESGGDKKTSKKPATKKK